MKRSVIALIVPVAVSLVRQEKSSFVTASFVFKLWNVFVFVLILGSSGSRSRLLWSRRRALLGRIGLNGSSGCHGGDCGWLFRCHCGSRCLLSRCLGCRLLRYGICFGFGFSGFEHARVVRSRILSQNSVDRSEQWVFLAAAHVLEIIEIESPAKAASVNVSELKHVTSDCLPNHSTAKSQSFHELTLVSDHWRVIERNPLIARVSVRTHSSLQVSHHFPVLLANVLTNLQEIGS